MSGLHLGEKALLHKLDVSNHEIARLNFTDKAKLSDLDAIGNPLIQVDLFLTEQIHTAYIPMSQFSLEYLQELEKAGGRPFGLGYRFGL